ncbi:MAG TPA: hypothetical protein VMB50_04530 [Myxococcales bacterium]|nr:hypothetical protein [Myxococcales bacterium]
MGRKLGLLFFALAFTACNQATTEGGSSGAGGGTGTGAATGGSSGGGHGSSGGAASSSGNGAASSSGAAAGGSSGGSTAGASSSAGSASGAAVGSSGGIGSSGGGIGSSSGGAASTGGGGSNGGGSCTLDSQCAGGDYCDYTVSPCGNGFGSGDVAIPGSCEVDCGTSCGACTSDADCAPDESCQGSSCQHLPACSCAFPGPCDAPCAMAQPPHDCCPVCLCPSCPSGTSGGASGGSTGGSGGCNAGSCQPGEVCCPGVDHCVYLPADTQNCGACGQACPAGDVCENSACVPPVCASGTSCGGSDLCCGQSCCGAGQICCFAAGGPARQYPYDCADADAGCPQPCLLCG